MQKETQVAVSDGLPTPRRTWATIAIYLTISMAVLDTAIANVALPTIARDLGASAETSIWVVNAYQIAIVMLLLPVAALGEIHGYRRTYVTGVALFVLASLGCTFADSLGMLAFTRFLQGFGAATIMAINGALIRFTYPRAMLGRGIGYNALVIALASAAGPSIAAAILAVASWRWLFAVNVPIGLLAIAIGCKALPHVPGTKARFGLISSALNALMFAAAFLAASSASHGRLDGLAALEALVAAASGTLLFLRVRTQERPLIPLDLLRVRVLRLSYATSISSFAAQTIGLLSLPFLLQYRFGFDHVQTGLMITPWAVAIAVTAPLAGRLVEHVPAAVLGAVGLAAMAAGLVIVAALPAGVGTFWLGAALFTCGAGFGLFQSPNNRVMLGTAPRDRSGAAAGMLATSRLIGQTAGAVLVAAVFHLFGPISRVPYLIGAALASGAAMTSLRRRGVSS